MNEYRTILVPFDFSEHASEGLELALDLAKRFDSAVQLLHVIPTPNFAPTNMEPVSVDLSGVRDSLFESLCDVAAVAEQRDSRSIVARVVGGVNIVDAIREAAEDISADLIVMGTHGRTGLAHLLLGSVTERTLRYAPCPVLTIRSAAAETRRPMRRPSPTPPIRPCSSRCEVQTNPSPEPSSRDTAHPRTSTAPPSSRSWQLITRGRGAPESTRLTPELRPRPAAIFMNARSDTIERIPHGARSSESVEGPGCDRAMGLPLWRKRKKTTHRGGPLGG